MTSLIAKHADDNDRVLFEQKSYSKHEIWNSNSLSWFLIYMMIVVKTDKYAINAIVDSLYYILTFEIINHNRYKLFYDKSEVTLRLKEKYEMIGRLLRRNFIIGSLMTCINLKLKVPVKCFYLRDIKITGIRFRLKYLVGFNPIPQKIQQKE